MIGSVQAFLVLSLSFIIGRLIDAQLHRYVVVVGGILTTLGHLCLSYTSHQGFRGQGNYALIFLAQGIIGGLGEGCYFVYNSQLAMQWFPHNRYLAIGVTSAGAVAGGLAYPPAISSLIKGFGFNNGVRIQAAIIGTIIVVILTFGSPPPKARKTELGSLWKVNKWVDRAALKCRPCMLLTASTAFIFFGYSPLLYHVTEWAEQEKFKVIWFLSIMNGCSIIGRIRSAWLASLQSRRANPLSVHAGSCFLAALTVSLAWPLASKKNDALAFCVVFGVLAGSILGLPASGVARIIPAESQESLGVWTVLLWSSCCLFALTGPAIAGVLRERFSIEAVGYWAGANLLAAGLLSTLAMLASPVMNDAKSTESDISEKSNLHELGYVIGREDV